MLRSVVPSSSRFHGPHLSLRHYQHRDFFLDASLRDYPHLYPYHHRYPHLFASLRHYPHLYPYHHRYPHLFCVSLRHYPHRYQRLFFLDASLRDYPHRYQHLLFLDASRHHYPHLFCVSLRRYPHLYLLDAYFRRHLNFPLDFFVNVQAKGRVGILGLFPHQPFELENRDIELRSRRLL